MTHVITEACICCMYTDCVEVCPVDCFRGGKNFMAIDPDECIDCGICVSECPVNAIYPEEEVPNNQKHMIELNEKLSHNPNWKNIIRKQKPLEDAEYWRSKKNKLEKLIR